MADIIGWYRERVTFRALRKASLDPGYSRRLDAKYLTLSGRCDDTHEHIRLEFSYGEARRIMDEWERYMREHPE